jgi:hypothetical protein
LGLPPLFDVFFDTFAILKTFQTVGESLPALIANAITDSASKSLKVGTVNTTQS